jgi:hypothetical protein
MSKTYRWAMLALGVWLLAWIWISWPSIQDDALIHLRYADHLLHQHFVTYDGIHRTFGASSLLYIAILACLRSFIHSPELPRAVSSVCHVILFAGLAFGLGKRLEGASRTAWILAMLLMVCVSSPSSVRWLDDGMETSLELCLVAGLVFALSWLVQRQRMAAAHAAVLLVVGFFTVLLRIEFLFLLGLITLMLWLSHWESGEGKRRRTLQVREVALAAAPVVGGLLALGFIYLTMHAILPDTAVAKAHDPAGAMGVRVESESVFLSSTSVGLGLLVLEAFSLVALFVQKRRLSLATLVANSAFPVVLALAMLRAQRVQGIRYFLWAVFFPTLWNLLQLAREKRDANARDAEEASGARWVRYGAYALAVVLLVSLVGESVLFLHLFDKRKATMAAFESEHLERLHDLRLTAYDIGYIGYFTQAPVCDVEGLVNGLARAKLTLQDRAEACAAEKPQIAFLAVPQMGPVMYGIPDHAQWSVCGAYDLGNLRHSDARYLLAAPDKAAEVCAAANATPEPLTAVWPDAAKSVTPTLPQSATPSVTP